MNNAMNHKSKDWQDDQALLKYQIISPLLDPQLDDAKRLKLRKEVADKYEVSLRTIYRYEEQFRNNGFAGLRPRDRHSQQSNRLPDNFNELLQEAILLKKEVPKRSVEQLIMILELEGRVAPGVLKRSTLQRHLYKAGFGVKQMQMYNEALESSSKRFCMPNRMMLVQADIKYGPYLPIGKKDAKVRTYLSSAIDDHSRFILASRFYATQEESIVEDTFHNVINRYGKFDRCYFDNGSQYVARQLKLSLAKLGINISHAPVRSGKSKGKIEKFHQVVDTFMREIALKKPKTLNELNAYWEVFLEAYYQQRPHDGIKEYYESQGIELPDAGITPAQEFNRDKRPLTFISTDVVAEAFLHHEIRRVDKGACISFQGRRYETKASLIGFKVEISYDPQNPEVITVISPGMAPFTAEPLKISRYCDPTPGVPVSLQSPEPTTSRLLDALELKHEESRKHLADALSFASYAEEVTD